MIDLTKATARLNLLERAYRISNGTKKDVILMMHSPATIERVFGSVSRMERIAASFTNSKNKGVE